MRGKNAHMDTRQLKSCIKSTDFSDNCE